MDRDLLWLFFVIGLVFVYGGWQGLYNLAMGIWLILGIVVVILITFFKRDLIFTGLKALFNFFFSKRRR